MPKSPKTLILTASFLLSGCGAPSFNLFGAFFPAWMVCALTGIVGALAARGFCMITGLSSEIPHQLAVCTAIGAILTILVWLLFFEL